MSNMVDYIDWRGDIKLTESNLNEIDKMSLSFVWRVKTCPVKIK